MTAILSYIFILFLMHACMGNVEAYDVRIDENDHTISGMDYWPGDGVIEVDDLPEIIIIGDPVEDFENQLRIIRDLEAEYACVKRQKRVNGMIMYIKGLNSDAYEENLSYWKSQRRSCW